MYFMPYEKFSAKLHGILQDFNHVTLNELFSEEQMLFRI